MGRAAVWLSRDAALVLSVTELDSFRMAAAIDRLSSVGGSLTSVLIDLTGHCTICVRDATYC